MIYSSFKNEVSDRMNNSYFSDGNSNEILRATNHALRDFNIGKVDDRMVAKRKVGYAFQREQVDLAYSSGTTRYTLSDYIPTLADIKWLDNVFIDSDENSQFIKRTADYFRRRRGINSSSERMWAEEWINGTRSILISNPDSSSLNILWYSNYMVDNGSGTRSDYLPETDNENYEFLMPEEFIDGLVDLTVAYLYLQDRNEQSSSSNVFLQSGRSTLQSMINSIGKREKKGVQSFPIMSEWGVYDN